MATPIVLPASVSQEALLNAIGVATSTDAPLQLGPGVHLTKPGRINLIPIGANGLSISAQVPSSHEPATIKRPDNAIDLASPDDNHGLFFVPAKPSPEEVSQLTWRPGIDDEGPMEFDVVIRGRITIDGIRVDCNMGNQGVESLPKDAAEHSSMLGFRGIKHRVSEPGVTPRRVVFVGFESVELTNLVADNGGYSDDIWFSRGGFYPNIVNVKVDHLTSTERVINRRRATLDFSGLCLNISITNCDIFKLGLEDTAMLYSDLPRAQPEFFPSLWRLSDVAMDGLDLGARGKVYVLHAARLTTRETFHVDRARGVIADSTFVVGSNRRLNRLDGLDFYNVHWTLAPDEHGVSRGLKPTAAQGDHCKVSFIDNVFAVEGVSEGEIINSEYSNGNVHNRVEVTALGCTYPEEFGADPARPIARVKERGVWRFSQADLGALDPDVALPKHPPADVYRFVG
jgi:hypothetical protein